MMKYFSRGLLVTFVLAMVFMFGAFINITPASAQVSGGGGGGGMGGGQSLTTCQLINLLINIGVIDSSKAEAINAAFGCTPVTTTPSINISWNGGTNKVQLGLVDSRFESNGSILGWILLDEPVDGSFSWSGKSVTDLSGTVAQDPATLSHGPFRIIGVSANSLGNYCMGSNQGCNYVLSKPFNIFYSQNIILPSFTTSSPTGSVVNIIGSPTLALTYDSANKESALTANFNISVTAGSQDLDVYQSANPVVFMDQTDASHNIGVSVTLSPIKTLATSVKNGQVYYMIPAGTTVPFVATGVRNPKVMFAGSYYTKFNSILAFNGDITNSFSISAPANQTNTVTIIGETSPYITSVTTPISPKQTMVISGQRLTASSVYIDNAILSNVTVAQTPDGKTISFILPNLNAGGHSLYVKNDSTGQSNNIGFSVNGGTPVPTQPIKILSVQCSPSSPKVNDLITANVTILNDSSVDYTLPFKVNFGGDAVMGSSMSAHAQTTVTIPNALTFQTAGPETVYTNIIYPLYPGSSEGNVGDQTSTVITFIAPTPVPVPVPTPTTCTSFTYSDWQTCTAGGPQNRTVASASPVGCTGGSPVLTRGCTSGQVVVSYNGNGNTGGAVQYPTETTMPGGSVTNPGPGTLVKTGYTFSGWNTSSDGTGTSYATGSTFNMGSASVTMYAKWTAVPVTPTPTNGACNSSITAFDSTHLPAASALCSTGNPSTLMAGGNTWSWTCAGTNGGMTATCSANLTLPPVATTSASYIIKTVAGNDASGNPMGAIQLNPNKPTYNAGDSVLVFAVPSANYKFSSWKGAITGSANPQTITMTSDKTVSANFVQANNTLTVVADNGTVNINPNNPVYNYGDVVTLTAIPKPGYSLNSWTGGVIGNDNYSLGNANSITVYMNGDRKVWANFAPVVVAPSCTDSDNGVNFGVKGQVTIMPSNETDVDYCSTENVVQPDGSFKPTGYLHEYSCSNGSLVETDHQCSSCSNGVCNDITASSDNSNQNYATALTGFDSFIKLLQILR